MNQEILKQIGKDLTDLKVRVKRNDLCDISIEGSDKGKIVISSLVGIGMTLTPSEAKELSEELEHAAEWVENRKDYLMRKHKIVLIKELWFRGVLKSSYNHDYKLFEDQALEYFEYGIETNEWDRIRDELKAKYGTLNNGALSMVDELAKQFEEENKQ